MVVLNGNIVQIVMFKQVNGLQIVGKEIKGGRDGKKICGGKERYKFWTDYMERVMNKEDDLDHNVEGDAVEGLVDC